MTTSFDSAVGGINFSAGSANGSKYSVKAGRANNPVVLVSWYDAIRFTNWLHNGQGSGDTETGAYTLTGGTPTPSNGSAISRNANASVVLPSENEWYKAAYYKAGGTNTGWWAYATRTNNVPRSLRPDGFDFSDGTNNANYYNYDPDPQNSFNDGYAVTGSTDYDLFQYYLTNVGAYTRSVSSYGTFDQNGNVHEWNEAMISGSRGIRGGSWEGGSFRSFDGVLPSSERLALVPSNENLLAGFRVASILSRPGWSRA